MTTDYHAKYWAHFLLAQEDTTADVTSAIAQAKVDLNPHQVEAASFALSSPLSRGVVLADEVGLGKTIEAGLVLLQLWSRRNRRLLIVVPATLRRQWASELEDKFGLPTRILDVDSYLDPGNPFDDASHVLICSYHFAAARRAEVRRVDWDRVVFDEAHQLRNVWKSGNQRAKHLAEATKNAPKLLLTATPLQNSLMELFGLIGFIDDHVFGDSQSFRASYSAIDSSATAMTDLKGRLMPLVKRTLRRQVGEYVKFTARVPITQDFKPTPDEQTLYELVSDYLQREEAYALPAAQRTLMTLILRKILASSPIAIGNTLLGMADRLEKSVAGDDAGSAGTAIASELEIDEDYNGEIESVAGTAWTEGGRDAGPVSNWGDAGRGKTWRDPRLDAEAKGRMAEALELRSFAELAMGIRNDSKSAALIEVLPKALAQAESRGASKKAVIFTESKRTQAFLVGLLEAGGYKGRVLTINGANTEPLSQELYSKWRDNRRDAGLSSGNRASDTKSAIVEAFRGDYQILVATEAAAEGLNLQFCSLVVNYDLPWNPQRVEQRIGRCHRYGQKHDVVVVNFLNRSNAADQRVYELLDEKFKLFSGVFGASDEVLGALASGLDLEKRIGEVYQRCRTANEIDAEFARLRQELEAEIEERMSRTRESLLEDFDDEVLERLDVELEGRKHALNGMQEALWHLTRHEMRELPGVEFNAADLVFRLSKPVAFRGLELPAPSSHAMAWADAERLDAEFYHHGTELAGALIEAAVGRDLPSAKLRFNYSNHGVTVGALEGLKGKRGWLGVRRASFESADSVVRLLLTGATSDGQALDADRIRRLLSLPGTVQMNYDSSGEAELAVLMDHSVRDFEAEQRERLEQLLEVEVEKLDRWADDLKTGLELEVKDLDRQLKGARKDMRGVAGLGIGERMKVERAKQEMERKRRRKKREIEEQEEAIDEQREELLSEIEAKLDAKLRTEDVLSLEWELV